MANKLKQKRERRMVESGLAVEADNQTALTSVAVARQGWWFGLSRNGKLLLIGMMMFVAVGAVGATLKYLEADAKREILERSATNGQFNNNEKPSWLNNLNPFLPNPPPPPTPQLSKEYLYAGSRLLNVQDANATAAPPADLAVWRPASGVWYVLGGPGSQQVFQQWGAPQDATVPGDYDGDGKTDFSVFRPTENNWYVLKSSDNSLLTFNFGLLNDKVAQADYDGDGRTDMAVFRQTSGLGYWYIWRSATNDFIGVQFGLSSDTPAPADYDGDGKADVAVWRSSNSTFYSINSSNTQVQTMSFTQASTKPVSADYDGDGRADYAIRSDANWIIKQSSNNVVQTTTWQNFDDIEVQNDYDGDGKVDIAVWRNATGYWYIKNSADNTTRTVQWGQANDIPVPAFYRR